MSTLVSGDAVAQGGAPVVSHVIPDQTFNPQQPFVFQFAADAFSDPDNDPLSYTATRSDGSALPSWLAFDAATRTFSGSLPPGSPPLQLAVKVTASDGTDTVSDTFNLVEMIIEPLPFSGTSDADTLSVTGGYQGHGHGGNDTITGAGNRNSVFGDEDNDLLHVNGDYNQLAGGDGSDWLGVMGNNNGLSGGAGDDLWIGATGNSNTLAGGDGQDALYVSGSNNYLYGENGNDWVGASGQSNGLFGGAGNDWIGATGGSNALAGGDGNDALFALGSNVLFGENGNDWLGCAGNANWLFGGAGNDYVGASGSNNVLDGGAGADHLVVAAGHDSAHFVFKAGYGEDDVSGFATHTAGGSDILDISGFGISSFGQLQPFITQAGNDTVITLGADVLTLRNVMASSLQQSDFLLA